MVKNIILYIIVFIIIFSSFNIPSILFKMESKQIEGKVYKSKRIENQIDVEAEKIYLVNAIHEMENAYSTLFVTNAVEYMLKTDNDLYDENNNIEIKEKIKKELNKLHEYDILTEIKSDEDNKYIFSMTSRGYRNGSNEYLLNDIQILMGEDKFELAIEEKTNKILSIIVKNDILYNKEDVMNNYIKYLDLYIIDDWKFENEMLKSEKANLAVTLIDLKNDYSILSIHSADIFMNNTQYYIKK